MINSINKFGVKQRCMSGEKILIDLMLVAIHYEKDKTFYICDENNSLIGIINREALLNANLLEEQARNVTLRELSRKESARIIEWTEGEELFETIYKVFQNFIVDEVVVVEKGTRRMVAIIDRRDFYNERLSVVAESDEEMLCYREMSAFYPPRIKNYNRFAANVNSQHGEDGILEEVFNRIGTTSKYAVEFGG